MGSGRSRDQLRPLLSLFNESPKCLHQLSVISVHRDSGFSEYAVGPVDNAYALPATIPDKLASMVEPFTIAANITAFLQLQPQNVTMIYGAGPMGLTAIQVLKGVCCFFLFTSSITSIVSPSVSTYR